MPNLSFDVFWKDHGASRGLQNLGKDADKTHGSFSKFTSGASKGLLGVAGTAAKFGAAGVAAFAAAGVAAVGYGLKTAAANENASIAFTTMLGSATKARNFLGQLQRFAATTPFEFPELQTAASSLISVGVNSAKVIPIMKTLGNVTSGMGTGAEGVKRATTALQQMQAAGRITAEDLNQLRDAGIPLNALFQGMAQYSNHSAKELGNMSREGKLGREELDALMKTMESGRGFERFNGLMEKQSQSLTGLWSTIKDTFGQGMAQAVAPAIPTVKRAMGGVSDALSVFSDWVKDNKGALGTVFEGAGRAISTFVSTSGKLLKTFATSVGATDGSFQNFADHMETNQAAITEGIFGMTETMVDFAEITQLSISVITILAGSLAKAVATAIATVTLPLQHLFELVAETPFAPAWVKKTAAGLKAFNDGTLTAMQNAGQNSIDFGRKLDERVGSSIARTRERMEQLRKQAIFDARQRDAAAALSQAVDRVGNSAKLSKEEARKFNGETDTGSKRQKTLAERLVAAREAFLGSYKASDKSRHGQEEFRKAARKTQTQLETELIKLGLNKELAHKYAKEITNIPTKQSTKASNNMGKDENPRKAVRGYAEAIRDIPETWMTKIQYDTSVDGINSRLVQRAGRFAVQMDSGGGSRMDLARSPATMQFLTSGKNLPNGFGGPDVTTAGSLAYQRAGQSGVSRALRDGARNSASGPYGSVTGGGAGRAAGIREGMRWATSGGTYPGHHPSMNKAWDFMATGSAGDRIAGHLWANRARLRLWYLIWNRRIISMTRPSAGWLPYFDGNSSNANRAHTNHVHASWYDRGGMLRPGGVALNGTSQPERILTGQQTRAFESLVRTVSRTGGATTIIINAPNYVGSTNDLRNTLVEMARRNELQVLTRR